MSNLPIQFIDKENSPALLAIMQQFGEHTYVDAELINKFRDALNELYFSSNPDRIISLGTETIDGNEYTYEDYTWQLGGVQINNIGNPSVIVIPSATIGFKRKDISVFTAIGTIERVAGTETDGEVVTSPDVPENTLYYKSYDIDGNTIEVDSEPSPITGTQFKQKNENQKFNPTLGGTTAVITIQPFGQNYYSVVGPVTGIVGFSKALITASPTAEVPYAGKDFYIENKTDHNVTLKNAFSPVDIPFNFGADLVVPTNGIVWLKYNPNTEKMDLFFKSWSEVDLSTKADLVGGKVPAEQLPSYVDDVVEGYFNGTNFYTDAGFTILIIAETSKIYLALDKNKTYRWSGSAYVQIGGGGKRTWMVAWTGILYFDGNSGSGNWSGLNATTGSTFGLLGGTSGIIFQTPVDTGGLPKAQSPARVIPYNCKIKSFHIRNGVSPFSAVNPANFRLRFYTHTPNGTTTLNNPILQSSFDSTGFNMPTNYVYPSSCFTNNNLTLQAGDVITPTMRGLQALTAGALISDFYLEFEEI